MVIYDPWQQLTVGAQAVKRRKLRVALIRLPFYTIAKENILAEI